MENKNTVAKTVMKTSEIQNPTQTHLTQILSANHNSYIRVNCYNKLTFISNRLHQNIKGH